MSTRTLVLTESMQPHDVVTWQEAVTMMFNGKVRVLETYAEIIGKVNFNQIDDFEHFLEDLPASAYDGDMIVLRTPSVMVLKSEINAVKRGVKFSRQNVFARDHFEYTAFRHLEAESAMGPSPVASGCEGNTLGIETSGFRYAVVALWRAPLLY